MSKWVSKNDLIDEYYIIRKNYGGSATITSYKGNGAKRTSLSLDSYSMSGFYEKLERGGYVEVCGS